MQPITLLKIRQTEVTIEDPDFISCFICDGYAEQLIVFYEGNGDDQPKAAICRKCVEEAFVASEQDTTRFDR
jgi:hypothetical protein